MTIFISLLRGINVSGQKIIRMAHLKALYEELGFKDAQTYIQSGNVVFRTSGQNPKVLEDRIRKALAASFGFDVPVAVRNSQEWQTVIAEQPFEDIAGALDGSRVLVAFLSEVPSLEAVTNLLTYANPPEKLVVRGRQAYLHCPGGLGKSKLSNGLIEKTLNVESTTRNWNTVLRIQAMSKP
jgi:uncharacterized protein (DUF1697 family)